MGNGSQNTAILETVVQGTAGPGPSDLNSYPAYLCEAPIATITDPLGYGNRECGSYVAQKMVQDGNQMPPHSVLNNAGYWPQNVDPVWLVTDPQPGDVAIVPVLLPYFLGHAMYICWVQANGDLVVKAYNRAGVGTFSMEVWARSGVKSGVVNGEPYSIQFALEYIRFPSA